MASTNKTTHYELSQYISTDKPTYLVDYNGDMLKIDTGINAAKTAADTAQVDATAAGTAASTAQTTANTAVTNAATAQTTADGANTKIGSLTNLDTTDKTNIVSAVNEVKGDFNTLSTYSTTETIVGKWIDNSPIYRKVVDFGSLPNATTKEVNHNISNINTVISIKAMAKHGTYHTEFPIPFVTTLDLASDISIYTNDTKVVIQTGSDRSGFTQCFVIIEYTKSTI